jgi:superfamily II DNA or RNA helicase
MMTDFEIKSRLLRARRSPEDYAVYKAALEWDLTDPIVIESKDDVKSAPRWRDRLEPYHHQVKNLITFCRRLPVTLLADDVGLGKTISAGLIISELLARSRLSNVLIVCPKLVGPQWREELHEKFNIPSEFVVGRKLLKMEPEEFGAVITTYHSARLYLDRIPEDRFQMLILDEAHKLRNLYGTQSPPQVARKFRDVLEQRRFRFVLMLTATPIQNRLWDIYSLVDLLAVARGHENPFGSEGMFQRRFIADRPDQARRLKTEAQEEFRSIVYGYMSRIRRGDAGLYFPERVVQMHRVEPSGAELRLIEAISGPIQQLNRLAQISILKALTSSPEALLDQLINMGRNGTVPLALVDEVRTIVESMPPSTKLQGLAKLVDELRTQNPDRWRLVVFTGRRETQTTIQVFFEQQGIPVGLISGSTGPRNQETLTRFRKDPPELRVIVSTDAGSEGVNLQVANVLVNYDLPWNPMIVEQRIGRVQRLASEHAYVSIFNIILSGTFEEYIVGRLMEKLQMAAHAIGDIESLLQGTDIGDGEEDAAESFEQKILELVLTSLAGKDVERATALAIESIEQARQELEREETTINDLLGSMDDAEYIGPQAPKLPPISHSMTAREFVLAALRLEGARLTPQTPNLYLADTSSGRELIRFEEGPDASVRGTLYAPGSAAFERLVTRIASTGVHDVRDIDQNARQTTEAISRRWVESFGARLVGIKVARVERCFVGKALVRIRSTVAHDSYERVVEMECPPGEHRSLAGESALAPLHPVIEDPDVVGIDRAKLAEAAGLDPGISEFSRFYLERREEEVRAAEGDERKRQKLWDDFTPRHEAVLVGLSGEHCREVEVRVSYRFDHDTLYESVLKIMPSRGEITLAPRMGRCALTGHTVPQDCLGLCSISGSEVLKHLLVASELSGRVALPSHTLICGFSGKRVLGDEVNVSDVTGALVAKPFLKTSVISGKRGEPSYFARCDFTGVEVLRSELAVSELSARAYRMDQQRRSAVSGKSGHVQEFVQCYETRQLIGLSEAERCEVTGHFVRPGILETCEETGRRALPSELQRCAVTGRRALKSLFVTSSISGTPLLKRTAIPSLDGHYCLPTEAQLCIWSGRICHPADVRICELTGLSIHVDHVTTGHRPRLQPLVAVLDGKLRPSDNESMWSDLVQQFGAKVRNKRCRIEAALLSPNERCLAICFELRTFFGLRSHHAGAIYDLNVRSFVGQIVQGRRAEFGWVGFE